MYYALLNGNKMPTERFDWVRLQQNDVFTHCSEEDGQGVVIDGEIYHVYGRPAINKPTVDLVWQDDVTRLNDEVSTLELAVTEIFETGLQQDDQEKSIMLAIVELYEMILGGES